MSLDFERCCPIVSNSTALRQNVACDHSMSWWLFAGSSMIILYWWLTYPSEKYESVGMIIPNIWRNKCSKPPTSRAISCYIILRWSQHSQPEMSQNAMLAKSGRTRPQTCRHALIGCLELPGSSMWFMNVYDD